MRHFLRLTAAFATAAFLSTAGIVPGLTAPAAAQTFAGPSSAAQPAAASFDYYLLSLSLAPTFCALSPANAAKSECRTLTPVAFRATPLTIHGLWPNRAHTGNRNQPQDCAGPAFNISSQTAAELRRYMPAGPGLARYEWRKHGTCSGLDPDTYFAAEARLAQHADDTIGTALLSEGNTIHIATLLQAVAAQDPALAAAIIVDCQTPRGGGDLLVSEIRITLDKTLHPIPAASVGKGQNSGCRNATGQIPN